jgi:hypothetical protein
MISIPSNPINYPIIKEKKLVLSFPLNHADPYGIPEQEQIGNELTKPLEDYASVYPFLPLHFLPSTLTKIEQKYAISPLQFLERLPQEKQIKIKVEAIDSYACIQMLKKYEDRGRKIGGIAGAILGGAVTTTYVMFQPTFKQTDVVIVTAGIGFGGVAGQSIGEMIGHKIGEKKVESFKHKQIEIYVKNSKSFGLWKEGLSKEVFDVLRATIKNHMNLIDRDIEGVKNCPILLEIPEFPVLGLDGQVYEKALIEKQLDIRWPMINELLTHNPSEARLNEYLRTVSPHRGQFFHKSDLVYATNYVKNARQALQEAIDELKANPDRDPIVQGLLIKIS